MTLLLDISLYYSIYKEYCIYFLIQIYIFLLCVCVCVHVGTQMPWSIWRLKHNFWELGLSFYQVDFGEGT